MMQLRIGLDKLLSTWVAQVREGLAPMLEAATRDTASWGKGQIIRSTAKGATGKTQGGWSANRIGAAVWKIWNHFKWALYLEKGTGLFGYRHARIYPKVAKFLSWIPYNRNTPGGRIFVKSTAGMPAQPAIEPNVEKIQKDLNIRVRNGVRKLYKTAKATGVSV